MSAKAAQRVGQSVTSSTMWPIQRKQITAGSLPAKFFGVLVKEEGQALRGTFVVDPDGVIKVYEIHDMGIGRNAEELLRKVQAAQFVREHGDQVCPAKWKPGEDTLTPSLDLVGKL